MTSDLLWQHTRLYTQSEESESDCLAFCFSFSFSFFFFFFFLSFFSCHKQKTNKITSLNPNVHVRTGIGNLTKNWGSPCNRLNPISKGGVEISYLLNGTETRLSSGVCRLSQHKALLLLTSSFKWLYHYTNDKTSTSKKRIPKMQWLSRIHFRRTSTPTILTSSELSFSFSFSFSLDFFFSFLDFFFSSLLGVSSSLPRLSRFLCSNETQKHASVSVNEHS